MPATSPGDVRAIIVHEHKVAAEFPNSVKRDTLVKYSMKTVLDEIIDFTEALDEEISYHVHDNLKEYWYHFNEDEYTASESIDFRSSILQVYVYMRSMYVRYGILSTTDRAWFMELNPDNTLHFSRVLPGTSIEKDSASLPMLFLL